MDRNHCCSSVIIYNFCLIGIAAFSRDIVQNRTVARHSGSDNAEVTRAFHGRPLYRLLGEVLMLFRSGPAPASLIAVLRSLIICSPIPAIQR